MEPQELFEIWAPPDAVWSSWAKPVLFATMRAFALPSLSVPETAALDPSWTKGLPSPSAVVVDLPGAPSVQAGLALAAQGFRPVPLYNTTGGEPAVVPQGAIAEALGRGAPALARLNLPPDAPPAFLLDALRKKGRRQPAPGDYDNRWLVFPQDFPSGNYLLSRGIQQAVLVTEGSHPADDLAHVLLRWQETGISVFSVDPTSASALKRITVTRPPFYRAMWYRAMVLLGLRRNSAGGFGAVIPQPSRGGYHGHFG